MSDPFTDQDGFTEHYLRELEALRKEGADFSERYPKIAARLRLTDRSNPDPHVERLIESFAFLSARIQRKLDDDFPELSDALLEVLYPHLTRPIPSMAIAEVELDLEQSVPTSGLRIERGTEFLSRPVRGDPLRFRSTSAVDLWPMRIVEADVGPARATETSSRPQARASLRLRLECEGEHPIGELELDALRFFLRGEDRIVSEVYELLCSNTLAVEVRAVGERTGGSFRLPADAIRPCGFEDEEAVLPYPRRSFSGYRLLQEYWAFPQKFHFIEVSGLAPLRGSHARSIELVFLLDREPRIPHASITGKNFSLSCVPLVNLFDANADPIRLSPHTTTHDVVPDAQRPLDLEVYSVEEVAGLEQGTRERIVHAPFYSLRHDVGAEATRSYWHILRRASRKKGDDGTEVSIALVDLDLERAAHSDETLHVRILCTNRDTPFQSSEWGRPDDFRPEGITGVAGVRCVHAPTRTLRPRLGGSQHWRMISQLSLNYLSIVREGRDALREILRVYDISDTPGNREQVEGILDVRSEPSVRWIQTEAGGGFGRGTRTTVVIDRDRFIGSCPLLLASVIEHFLARYCAVNSFSELSLETPQDQGEVHRWSPRAGDRVLL